VAAIRRSSVLIQSFNRNHERLNNKHVFVAFARCAMTDYNTASWVSFVGGLVLILFEFILLRGV
jgi:hypothetical protein